MLIPKSYSKSTKLPEGPKPLIELPPLENGLPRFVEDPEEKAKSELSPEVLAKTVLEASSVSAIKGKIPVPGIITQIGEPLDNFAWKKYPKKSDDDIMSMPSNPFARAEKPAIPEIPVSSSAAIRASVLLPPLDDGAAETLKTSPKAFSYPKSTVTIHGVDDEASQSEKEAKEEFDKKMKILEDKAERKEDKASDPSISKTVAEPLAPLPKEPTVAEK